MVVEHVVLFKLREGAEGDQDLVNAFGKLRLIPVVKDVHFGKSFTTARADGFTHVLNVHVNKKEDLPAYANHPLHLALVALLKPFLLTEKELNLSEKKFMNILATDVEINENQSFLNGFNIFAGGKSERGLIFFLGALGLVSTTLLYATIRSRTSVTQI